MNVVKQYLLPAIRSVDIADQFAFRPTGSTTAALIYIMLHYYLLAVQRLHLFTSCYTITYWQHNGCTYLYHVTLLPTGISYIMLHSYCFQAYWQYNGHTYLYLTSCYTITAFRPTGSTTVTLIYILRHVTLLLLSGLLVAQRSHLFISYIMLHYYLR